MKQSSKCWNNEINKYLLELGFIRSDNDFCLYFMKSFGEENIYLAIYVDDLLISGRYSKKLNFIVEKLIKFEMKDKGNLEHFLGIQINYDRENGILKMHQGEYIKRVLLKIQHA